MTIFGLRLPVFCLFFIGFPLVWLLWIGAFAFYPPPSSQNSPIDVVFPTNTGISGIERILIDNEIIRDDPRFSMLAVLTGSAKKLQAGEYRFVRGLKPLAVIDLLKKGKVLYRSITLPEGLDMERVAAILEAGGWVDSARFLDLAHDPDILREMQIEAESLEGYLFPDTYYLSRGQLAEKDIIRMMVARHKQIYEKLRANTAADSHGLTHHQIITLAAIVEKETGLAHERPLVASVFLNRLARGMRLQADPTVRYGYPNSAGPLKQSELKRRTPYNTYIIKGLPPGPIANPGEAAIQAVLSPARADYLYFVLKDDGSHHFSMTLKEHNRAVARFRSGNRKK